jgi:hypothetical protein
VQRGALLNDYNSGDDTPFLIAASVDDGQAKNLVSDVLQYLASAGARATRPARDLLAQPEHRARLEAAARGARARRDFLDSCFIAAAEERVRAVVRSLIPKAEREQAADAAAAAGLAEAELSSEEIREVFLRRVSPLARAVAAEMAAKHLGNSALEDSFSTWSQPLADEIAQFRSLRTSRGREPTKSKIAARFALGAARVAKCQQAEMFFAGEARRLRSGLEIEREEANKNSRWLQEMLDPEQ